MSWFNWPPDPEPKRPIYFSDHKLVAERIDPGIALAMRIFREENQLKEDNDVS